MWIDRVNTEKITKAVNTRPVVLLTGVRQVGKSSLLKKLFKDAEFVTLDRIALAEEANANPTRFLERFKGSVIIDEVQYAPILFRELKVLVDENRELNGKWILTGSQKFELMKGVSESLAGRARILSLDTLSPTELIKTSLYKNKRDFLWKGGFPEVWAQNLDVTEFFEDYTRTYLERDLKEILNVNNLHDFRRMLLLLSSRIGQLLNYSSLAKDLGVSVNTVKSWISALEISGLIILVPPFYNGLGKRIIKSPKIYFCDQGIAAYFMNIRSLENLEASQHLGNLWENFVLAELLKEGFVPGTNLFFFRDQNGVEIDFIAEKNGKTFLIEAKSSERPDPKKLNFQKIAPLFDYPVECILACGIEEKGLFHFKDYKVYNPLFGFGMFEE